MTDEPKPSDPAKPDSDPPFISVDINRTGAHFKVGGKPGETLSRRDQAIIFAATVATISVAARVLAWLAAHYPNLLNLFN